MSPLDEAIIRRKLAIIIENLEALRPIQQMTRDEYAADLYRRKATERLLQELIEAAIDVNTHILVQNGHAAPDDYYDSFLKVGQLQMISYNLADKLAPSAGLRNRLIHQYDQIDHSILLQAVRMAEELYSEYVSQVEQYLTKNR